jgi:hypothetical protein
VAVTALRLALVALLACVGCSKKPTPPQRTEPWLANPSSSSSSVESAPRTYHFLSDSRIRFTLPGRKGKVSGRLPLTEGLLHLLPRDLKSASASIDVDLTKLSIDAEALPEAVALGGSSPNGLGLQWLELGPAVAAERRSQLSKAHFELSAVEGLSATVLDLNATRAHVRVRATVTGTLLLHGFRAPIRCDVLLEPLQVLAGAPPRLSIRSVGALVVPLLQHDIAARGPAGIADPLAGVRAADWVGKNAHVEFELLAEAQQPN